MTSLLRLYMGDAVFRSSLDFAVIGLAVYLFVAPLPMFDWLSQGGTPASKSHLAASKTAVSTPPHSAPGIAQAADPNNLKTRPASSARPKVRRDWFHLSDPAIHAALHKAADLLDNTLASAALSALEEIGRPDDPNVANMTAYAHLQNRTPDRLQRAFDAHLRAANAGHPASMHQVGQMLRLGTLGKTDLVAATDWYEKAAAAGSAAAATEAGRAYYNGWSRPIDHAKGAAYYKQAADGGDPWGMHNYAAAHINGQGVPLNLKTGREWMERSAKTGLATAQHNMSKLVRKGIGGPRDLDAFIRWAQLAANQGLAPALYDLGMFFLEPEDGRAADPARAAGYLRQAALKKHSAAQFAYATLCERGVGMQVNTVQAFVYYSLALRGGQNAAQARLDALRERMSAQEVATAQKLVAAAAS